MEPKPMTDEEFAAEANLTIEEVGRMTPGMRASAERLIQVSRQLEEGERPHGALVCGPRENRGA